MSASREVAERLVERLGELLTDSLDQLVEANADPNETAEVLVDRFRALCEEMMGPKWAPLVTVRLGNQTKQAVGFGLAILIDTHKARKNE